AALVDSSVATFTRVTFKSGAAGKGDDGASTSNYANATASDGKPATNNQGGPSVVCRCTNADTSTGALGGTGDVATPTGGGNGLPNLNGTSPNDGKGG